MWLLVTLRGGGCFCEAASGASLSGGHNPNVLGRMALSYGGSSATLGLLPSSSRPFASFRRSVSCRRLRCCFCCCRWLCCRLSCRLWFCYCYDVMNILIYNITCKLLLPKKSHGWHIAMCLFVLLVHIVHVFWDVCVACAYNTFILGSTHKHRISHVVCNPAWDSASKAHETFGYLATMLGVLGTTVSAQYTYFIVATCVQYPSRKRYSLSRNAFWSVAMVQSQHTTCCQQWLSS